MGWLLSVIKEPRLLATSRKSNYEAVKSYSNSDAYLQKFERYTVLAVITIPPEMFLGTLRTRSDEFYGYNSSSSAQFEATITYGSPPNFGSPSSKNCANTMVLRHDPIAIA
ncbi:hypothetical protein F444_01853 [Phytophthora nicotianae P1976]|uniref:Uncharacterized protein n=1 Tax=Phytophthora nicotianae P1976 TaxID=1317066 RepID=A0A081AZB8_PHYNI|nr:hypothetical protein F444_01853 [Phytophthora nicotianae P1976]